jgi:hypothetical protein
VAPLASMTNILSDAKTQQVIALGQLGWTLLASRGGRYLGAAARGSRTRGRLTCGVTWRCGKRLSPLERSPYGRFWPVHVWPDLRCPPGFPKTHQWVGFPHQSAQRLQSGGSFEIVAIPYVQASWFVRHPGLSYRCGPNAAGQP